MPAVGWRSIGSSEQTDTIEGLDTTAFTRLELPVGNAHHLAEAHGDLDDQPSPGRQAPAEVEGDGHALFRQGGLHGAFAAEAAATIVALEQGSEGGLIVGWVGLQGVIEHGSHLLRGAAVDILTDDVAPTIGAGGARAALGALVGHGRDLLCLAGLRPLAASGGCHFQGRPTQPPLSSQNIERTGGV